MPKKEEMVISDPKQFERGLETEELDSLTITIKGPAYKKLESISKKLQDANATGDVINVALSLLLQTEGKKIKLEKDDGETVLVKIWR